MKVEELKNLLVVKQVKEEAIKTKYKDKEKVKRLTLEERVARLEELHGIVEVIEEEPIVKDIKTV
jgi:hypothetical protein